MPETMDRGPDLVTEHRTDHGKREVVVLDARVVSGKGGGPEKTILNSPRFLVGTSYRMLCAYMHAPEDADFESIRRRAAEWGAPLLPVTDRGPLDWRVFAQLLAICRRERVTIWHGHDYKSDLIGLLLRPFWPMRLVTTVHGWGVAGTPTLYTSIDRLCLPRYERVICVSEDLRSQCLASGVKERSCVLIENGVDLEQYSATIAVAEAKARLGIPASRFVVGAVGRLSGEKAFDLLIRAVDQLLRDGADIELLIVGEGNQRPRLESLVAELGRADCIRLLGFRTNPHELYRAMDLYVLSSLSEGLPNVLLEAMAMGVSVVATRIGGVPRLVSHEENGVLIEPGSVDELAGALTRMLADPALRDRMGRAGRATIEARYSFQARMQKIIALYDDLVGPAAPACRS